MGERQRALDAIEKAGILLVYPIKNQREPPSLWSKLYPRSPMRWDWADTADDRVVNLWHLKTELSESRDVVYAKWYRGRATFFSREVFAAMLRLLDGPAHARALAGESQGLYQLLLDDSPQTSRSLREALDIRGKVYDSAFERGMRPLWQRLLAVGFGEVDEGSYPSLAIGATKHLFEELWDDAGALGDEEARRICEGYTPPGSAFHKHLTRLLRQRGSAT